MDQQNIYTRKSKISFDLSIDRYRSIERFIEVWERVYARVGNEFVISINNLELIFRWDKKNTNRNQ